MLTYETYNLNYKKHCEQY